MARDATEEKRIERVYAAEADRVGRVLETFYSLFLFFVRSPSLVAECPPDQMIPHARARRYGSCRLAFDTRGRGRVGCFPEKRKKGIGNIPLNAKVKGAERSAMDGFSPFCHFFLFSCVYFWIVWIFLFPSLLNSFSSREFSNCVARNLYTII